MAAATLELFLRHLRFGDENARYALLPDGELLAAYGEAGDERAFVELVSRHGPMVLATCRRAIGPAAEADAEDAFQAAFAVLAAKAKSLRGQTLPGWLHRVALQCAQKVGVAAARRAARERKAGEQRADAIADSQLGDSLEWAELKLILDEELDALPEKQRQLLVRHYLMGRSYDQVAAELGIARGSVGGQLDQAKESLRDRLKRRGISAPAAIAATGLALAGGKVSASLLALAVNESLGYTSGGAVRPAVAAAARQVIAGTGGKGLKVSLIAASMVALASAAAAAGALLAGAEPAPRRALPAATPPAAAQPKVSDPAVPAVTVTGRVVGADGRPLAGADVAAFGNEQLRGGRYNRTAPLVAVAKAGADGGFRLEVPARLPTLATSGVSYVRLFASAPDHSAATFNVPINTSIPHLTLPLSASRTVRGRVDGPDGKPVAGVRVVVTHVGKIVCQPAWGVDDAPVPSPWPAGATTDSAGDFEIAGVDPVQGVSLEIADTRFAAQRVSVPADVGNRKLSVKLGRRQLVEGGVACGDTREPLAGARVVVVPAGLADVNDVNESVSSYGRTDAAGRFAIPAPRSGRPLICVYPPDGSPYLAVRVEANSGADGPVDVRLPRGVLVQGTVTHAATGRPVEGARAYAVPDRKPEGLILGAEVAATTDAAGRFRLATPAGKGTLLVQKLDGDFLCRQVGLGTLVETRGPCGVLPLGEQKLYAHAGAALDLKAGRDPAPLKLKLEPGRGRDLRVVGPDGQPLQVSAILGCRNHTTTLYREFPAVLREEPQIQVVVRGSGRLPGCGPRRRYTVLITEPRERLGAVAEIGPDDRDVALAPCGEAVLRVTDAAGQPVPRCPVTLWVGLPGDVAAGQAAEPPTFADDAFPSAHLDPLNHEPVALTNLDGRVRLKALVPGARYWVTALANGQWHTSRPFVAASGQSVKLNDFVLARPISAP